MNHCSTTLDWALVEMPGCQAGRTWISCGVSQISQRISLCWALGSLPGSCPLHVCSHAPYRQTSYAFQYPGAGPSRHLWTFDLDPAEIWVCQSLLQPAVLLTEVVFERIKLTDLKHSMSGDRQKVWKCAFYCSTNKDAQHVA